MQSSTKTTKVTSCALAAKTVRACESCLMRRARWYCASDNAFLCHACDNSIHVANKLASRHKRARLESASFKTQTTPSIANPSFHSAPSLSPSTLPPPWHGGFTRKARTPRHGPHSNKPKSNNSGNNNNKNNRVVPEIGSENEGDDDLCGSLKIDKENDQLMFSVPVFDPFEISSSDLDHQNEFCENSKVFGGGSGSGSDGLDLEAEFDISLIGFDDGCDQLGRDNSNNDDDENKWNNFNPGGFMPSDAELAEFAADVETLLVDDVEEGRMKRISPLLDDYKVENMYDHENYGMKVEDDQLGESVNMAAFSSCWGLDFSIKCDDKKAVAEEEENLRRWVEDGGCDGGGNGGGKESEIYSSKKIFLRLNYDAVISAWASRGSPWTSGCRPELDGLGGWPSCMGGVGTTGVQNPMGEMGRAGHVVGGDGGRGARVLRYREKRKSRLFSKKIRYQVRKLNAEKRPRLKGRFVKRTPSTNYSTSPLGVQPTFPYLKV